MIFNPLLPLIVFGSLILVIVVRTQIANKCILLVLSEAPSEVYQRWYLGFQVTRLLQAALVSIIVVSVVVGANAVLQTGNWTNLPLALTNYQFLDWWCKQLFGGQVPTVFGIFAVGTALSTLIATKRD